MTKPCSSSATSLQHEIVAALELADKVLNFPDNADAESIADAGAAVGRALRLAESLSSTDERASALEEAARVCDAMIVDWRNRVEEGSEAMAYEVEVLNDAACAIRRLISRPSNVAPSSTAPSELEQKLDAIAKALGYPVECWRMAGCDVMAHAIGDLIANYGRLQEQFYKIDATLDELGAPVDCEWEGIKTRLSRRGRIKALRSSIGGASLSPAEIEDWRKRIKAKIFSDFCGEPNEAHGKKLQAEFDRLCDMAIRSLLSATPAASSIAAIDWQEMDRLEAFGTFGGRIVPYNGVWKIYLSETNCELWSFKTHEEAEAKFADAVKKSGYTDADNPLMRASSSTETETDPAKIRQKEDRLSRINNDDAHI